MEFSKVEQSLSSGNMYALFRKFAIPSILELLLIGLQPMIDGLFLSHFVSAGALAGVNLFMPLYSFLSAVSVVVGVGCQTLVSISLGKKDYQGAHDSFKTAFIALMLFSLVCSAFTYFYADQICRLLGTDETLIHYTREYMKTLCFFFPFIILIPLGDYILKSTGRTMLSLGIISVILLLNIFLDWFIVGFLGMGVKGAGIATGSAFLASFVLIFYVLSRPDSLVDLRKGRFRSPLILRMLYNGSSEGISELSAGITMFLFNWYMMDTWGASGVAAYTAVTYLMYFGILLFVGMSEGIIPILSYNFGAGKFDRMKAAMSLGFKVTAVIGAMLFCVMFFGGEFLTTLFFDSEHSKNLQKILSIASTGIYLTSFSFLLNGANILVSSFFTSMGDARTSVIISVLRGLLLVVIGILVLPSVFGAKYGIWLTIPVAEVLTYAYCLYAMRKKTPWLA